MAVAKYNCSQTNLYAAAHEGVDRLIEHLADFARLFPEFTLEYAQGIKARINAADALPDHDARLLLAEDFRLAMDKQRQAGVYQFGIFLSTIDKICSPTMRKTTYDAAGRKHYRKAKRGNLSAMIPMYSSLNSFIKEHWSTLSNAGKMTTAQREDFLAKQALFQTDYDALSALERKIKEKKDKKINANNACFDEMMSYAQVAQRVYADNPKRAKTFTFASFRSAVETVRHAGLSGKITHLLNNMPIEGATITIQDYNKSAVTAKSGKFKISPLSMGIYTVIVTCPRFEPQTFNAVKIKTGVKTRLNVQLVAVLV